MSAAMTAARDCGPLETGPRAALTTTTAGGGSGPQWAAVGDIEGRRHEKESEAPSATAAAAGRENPRPGRRFVTIYDIADLEIDSIVNTERPENEHPPELK